MQSKRKGLEILRVRRQQIADMLDEIMVGREEPDMDVITTDFVPQIEAVRDTAKYEPVLGQIDELIERIERESEEPNAAHKTVRVGRYITLDYGDDSGDSQQQEFLLLDAQGGIDLGEYDTMSTDSPVGAAILGKQEGDSVTVDAPNGETTVRIVSVD